METGCVRSSPRNSLRTERRWFRSPWPVRSSRVRRCRFAPTMETISMRSVEHIQEWERYVSWIWIGCLFSLKKVIWLDAKPFQFSDWSKPRRLTRVLKQRVKADDCSLWAATFSYVVTQKCGTSFLISLRNMDRSKPDFLNSHSSDSTHWIICLLKLVKPVNSFCQVFLLFTTGNWIIQSCKFWCIIFKNIYLCWLHMNSIPEIIQSNEI